MKDSELVEILQGAKEIILTHVEYPNRSIRSLLESIDKLLNEPRLRSHIEFKKKLKERK